MKGFLILTINAVEATPTAPIHNPLIFVAAGLIAAVVILVGAILLFRSSGKKKRAQATASSSDWQRQGQGAPGGMNNWGQPGMGGQADNPWAQSAQQPGWGAQNAMQQPGGWGAQSQNPGQQSGWGAQGGAQSQSGWGGQNPPQPVGWDATSSAQQQPGTWGSPNPVQQQQQSSGWGNTPPAQQQPSGWGSPNPAQQQQPAGWGNPVTPPPGPVMGSQQPWETAGPTPFGTPQQDAWAQQAQQPAGWGSPQAPQGSPMDMQGGATAMPQMPHPSGYGANPTGQGWGQAAQGPDHWAQPSSMPQQGGWPQSYQPPVPGSENTALPSWQQQGPGQSMQGFANAAPGRPFNTDESDKTILRSAPTQGPAGRLGIVRIEEGKEPGRVYEVNKESLSIGRSRESDIFLEDLAVSRLHASIINQGSGNYVLRDEGSANGTKVNGTMVNKYQPYPLQEGDKIQLGQTVLVFAKR